MKTSSPILANSSIYDISSITVIILAGGRGTRLQPVISDRPKVLALVNGRPFLSYVLDKLYTTRFKRVVLCTEYKAHQVQDTFGDIYKDMIIQHSHEKEPLGTGGALRQALSHVESGTVLVMNGDSFIDTDVNIYLRWHFQNGYEASLISTHVQDFSCYGLVKLDKTGRVIRFEEKKIGTGPGWINAGVYLLKTSLIELIPTGTPFSLERDFLPSLAAKNLYAFLSKGDFIDIGTPESYVKAENFFREISCIK